MSFPRYPKYKDSGVEWLGEVPEHWEVKRLKYLGEAIIGLTYAPPDIVDEGGGTLVLRSSNVQGGKIVFDDNVYVSSVIPEDLVTRVGDILICSRNGSRDLIGKNATIGEQAEGVTFGAFMTVFRSAHNSYLAHVLNSQLFAYQSGAFLTSTINQLTVGVLNNIEVPMPPVSEQRSITAFLNQETAKIDELVAEQQRLIELLKEKRQAVISHAVTKGLNPHAPMKPSGIEWLGDVPAHWGVVPLKYLVSLRSGGTPSKANLDYWDGDVPWASSKDLKSEELADTQDHITQRALDDRVAELIPAGSILTVVRGMILLHTFPVVTALVPMAINQDLKALSPRSKLDADFLAWLLRGASAEILSRTDEAAHGTKVLRLDVWLSMVMPVPPLAEQRLITIAVREQLAETAALIAEAKRAIALLQERRTALISAAVTGQIDVRHMAESEIAA